MVSAATPLKQNGRDQHATDDGAQYFSIVVGDQLFGIPIMQVQDVHSNLRMTPIPLAPPEIAGAINIRGRIVTAVDLRQVLGYPPRTGGRQNMSVVVEHHDVAYSLLIDKIGDVLTVSPSQIEKNPPTMNSRLREVSTGVSRLEGELMIVTDVPHLLSFMGRQGQSVAREAAE